MSATRPGCSGPHLGPGGRCTRRGALVALSGTVMCGHRATCWTLRRGIGLEAALAAPHGPICCRTLAPAGPLSGAWVDVLAAGVISGLTR